MFISEPKRFALSWRSCSAATMRERVWVDGGDSRRIFARILVFNHHSPLELLRVIRRINPNSDDIQITFQTQNSLE